MAEGGVVLKPQLSVDGRLRKEEWWGKGRGSFKTPIKCSWEADGGGVVGQREGVVLKPQLSVDWRMREEEWWGRCRGSFKTPIKCG